MVGVRGLGGGPGWGWWTVVGGETYLLGTIPTTRRTRGVFSEFWSLVGSVRHSRVPTVAHLRVLFNPSLSLTLTVTNKLTMHIAGFLDIV